MAQDGSSSGEMKTTLKENESPAGSGTNSQREESETQESESGWAKDEGASQEDKAGR